MGQDHPLTLQILHDRAVTEIELGRTVDAIPLLERLVNLSPSRLGPSSADAIVYRNDLAVAYRQAGRVADAIVTQEQAVTLAKASLGPEHLFTLSFMHNLGLTYRLAHRSNEAIDVLNNVLRLRKAKLGAENLSTLTGAVALAGAQLDAGRWTDAELTARECSELLAKKHPEDWLRFLAMSAWGAALAGQRKYPEAEPLLIGGYEELKAREARIPGSRKNELADAAARIVPFYLAWGQTKKADDWKARLAPAQATKKPPP